MKQFIPFLLLPMLALSVAAAGTSGGERQIRLEDIERDTLAAARQRQAAKQSKQVPQGSQAQQLKGASISEAEHPQLYSPQYGQRTQLVHPQLIQQQLAQQHLTPQQLSQQQLAHPQLSQYQLGQQQLVQQHYPASIAQQPEQQVVHLRPEQLSAYLQRQHSQQAALLQQLYQPQHPALAAYSQPQQTLSAYSQPQKATPSAGHAQSQQQALAAYAQQQALTAHAQPQQALTGHAQPQQALVAYAQQQALNAHAQPQQALTANGHQQALAGHGQSTRPQQLQQQPVYYYQPGSSAKPTAAYSAAAGGHSAAPAYYFPQGSFAGASSGIPNSALSSYVDPQQQQYLQLQLQQYLQQQYPGHLYRYQVAAPAAGLGTSGAAAPGSTLQYSSAQRQALANHGGSPATAAAPQQAVQYVYQKQC